MSKERCDRCERLANWIIVAQQREAYLLGRFESKDNSTNLRYIMSANYRLPKFTAETPNE